MHHPALPKYRSCPVIWVVAGTDLRLHDARKSLPGMLLAITRNQTNNPFVTVPTTEKQPDLLGGDDAHDPDTASGSGRASPACPEPSNAGSAAPSLAYQLGPTHSSNGRFSRRWHSTVRTYAAAAACELQLVRNPADSEQEHPGQRPTTAIKIKT